MLCLENLALANVGTGIFHGTCLPQLADRSEAEDLVQETYTKAVREFSSFQLGTNFRA